MDTRLQTHIADVEAEYGFLGCLLSVRKRDIQRVSEKIKPEHFSQPVLGELWRCMVAKDDAKEAFTEASLRHLLTESGVTMAVAADCMTSVTSAYHSDDVDLYVNRLLTLARRRMMLDLSRLAAQLADLEDPGMSVEDRLRDLSEALAEIEGANPSRRKTRFTMPEAGDRALSILQEAWQTPDGIVGVKTGLSILDNRLLGMRPGALYVCAGRPSMGKTVFGQTVAYNAAAEGKNVVFLSQEMTAAQVHLRLMARRLKMSTNDMRKAREPYLIQRIHKIKAALNNMPLVIDDAARQTVGKMRGWLERRKAASKLDLLIVDYIGLMAPDTKGLPKVYAIEEIVQGLKTLAKDLDIPVLALCQLSRAVESREGGDRRPQQSDLRDSGAIEQEADTLMMLYRQEYYLERQKPQQTGDRMADMEAHGEWLAKMDACRGKAEIHVPKNRDGEVGFDTFEFSGAFQEFCDLEAGT